MVHSGDRGAGNSPKLPDGRLSVDSPWWKQLTTVSGSHLSGYNSTWNQLTDYHRALSHLVITNPLEIVAKSTKTFASILNSNVIQRKKERENVVLTGLLFANQYLNINWTVTVS